MLEIGPNRSLQLYISWRWIRISGEHEISDYSPDENGFETGRVISLRPNTDNSQKQKKLNGR